MTADDIRRAAVDYYLGSSDFNGLPVRDVVDPSSYATRTMIAQLVKDGVVHVIPGELEINPYINRLGFPPTEAVLEALPEADLVHAVIYPTQDDLALAVKPDSYAGRPFDRYLALGGPQLSLRFFDLAILEQYRQDPRFKYDCDDIRGSISITSDHGESPETDDRDKTFLSSFGIGYDERKRPVVCAFLRYLADFEPAHQQVWHARQLTTKCSPHPDYIRNSILGEWGQFISMYDAVLYELDTINRMCESIGWPPLFRQSFKDERPKEFGMLLRPTAKMYRHFVELADKLLSENLNRDFFRNRIPLEEEEIRPDGRVSVKSIGTIRLLQNWIASTFRTTDQSPIDDLIRTFKEVRGGRNPSAHAILEDRFDYTFIDDQRALMRRVYDGVRTLRLMLANHPRARRVEIPEVIVTGEMIWPL